MSSLSEEVIAEQPPRLWWRTLTALLRMGISGGVIAFLLLRADLRSLGRTIEQASAVLLGLSVGLAIVLIAVSGIRWEAFLRALDLHVRRRDAIRLFFVGTFFNAFLPTGVGGDAYKVVRLRGAGGSLTRGLASVLLDRLAGLVGLVIIGTGAAVVRGLAGDRGRVLAAAVVTIAGSLAASVIARFGDRLVRGGRSSWFGLRPRLRSVLGSIATAWRDPRAFSRGVLAGLLSQGLMLGAVISIGAAIGIDVPIASLALVLLLVTVAAMAPLTINGLGVREAVWVWGLTTYGVPTADALALGLLFLGVSLASSLVGGAVYAVVGGEVSLLRGDGPG